MFVKLDIAITLHILMAAPDPLLSLGVYILLLVFRRRGKSVGGVPEGYASLPIQATSKRLRVGTSRLSAAITWLIDEGLIYRRGNDWAWGGRFMALYHAKEGGEWATPKQKKAKDDRLFDCVICGKPVFRSEAGFTQAHRQCEIDSIRKEWDNG